MTTDYETLGIPQEASPERVKRAYRRLAKIYHPDLCPGELGTAKAVREPAADSIAPWCEKVFTWSAGKLDLESASPPSAISRKNLLSIFLRKYKTGLALAPV